MTTPDTGEPAEDGGEALRREVERLCDEAEAAAEEYIEAQGSEYNGIAWVSIGALRAALAAAAVRERREDDAEVRPFLESRPSAEVMAGIERIANATNLPPDVRPRFEDEYRCVTCGSDTHDTIVHDPLPRAVTSAPVGDRSQDEQEPPEGYAVITFLPTPKYFLKETDDGWEVWTDGDPSFT